MLNVVVRFIFSSIRQIWYVEVRTSISEYFREFLELRENESRLYLKKMKLLTLLKILFHPYDVVSIRSGVKNIVSVQVFTWTICKTAGIAESLSAGKGANSGMEADTNVGSSASDEIYETSMSNRIRCIGFPSQILTCYCSMNRKNKTEWKRMHYAFDSYVKSLTFTNGRLLTTSHW